jgi:hypothetical protein
VSADTVKHMMPVFIFALEFVFLIYFWIKALKFYYANIVRA